MCLLDVQQTRLCLVPIIEMSSKKHMYVHIIQLKFFFRAALSAIVRRRCRYSG